MTRAVFFSLVLFACSTLAYPQDAPTANCWKSLASVKNGPRQEHGVAAIGKTIYVVGGTKMGQQRGQDASVEKYSIDTNEWSDVAPVPQPLHHPNVAAVDGKLYILGGLSGFNPTRKTLGNVYRYDPATNKWDELAPMPNGTERGSSAIAVKGSSIYLAGGLQPQMGDVYFGQRVTGIASSYDTITGAWSTLPKIPERRDHVAGAFVDDTYFVIGGRAGDITPTKGTVFALKPNATEWTSLAQMPTPRGGLTAAVLGTKIYTFSGEGNMAPNSRNVFPDVEAYETVANTWTKEPAMKEPRHGTGAVSVEGAIYIPGGGLSGGGSASVATLEAYGPGSC